MTREQFKHICDSMVETYGVRSYQDNLNDDPDDAINDELWFQCPECDEPIYFEDFADSDDLRNGYCPVCGEDIVGGM